MGVVKIMLTTEFSRATPTLIADTHADCRQGLGGEPPPGRTRNLFSALTLFNVSGDGNTLGLSLFSQNFPLSVSVISYFVLPTFGWLLPCLHLSV